MNIVGNSISRPKNRQGFVWGIGVTLVIAIVIGIMWRAGMGVRENMDLFRRIGMGAFTAGLIGSVILSALGLVLILLFGLND
ncbi:hypothetical protein [Paenibacillus sp. Z6-24]